MDKDFKSVYVRGTKSGKGVIEVLEERGGVNSAVLFGTGSSKDHIYYIDPVTNKIISTNKDSPAYNMVISNYTEIPPLKSKRWRAERTETYYTLDSTLDVIESSEYGDRYDEGRYISGNYFRTRKDAERAAEKIKKMLLP